MFLASGAEADQDYCDADLTYSEAAEPLTKKRVAFKDDIVDDAEMDFHRSPPDPRRSVSASPHDNFSPTPPGTGTHTPPRPNRFAPRGRPGGVPSRRPLPRWADQLPTTGHQGPVADWR